MPQSGTGASVSQLAVDWFRRQPQRRREQVLMPGIAAPETPGCTEADENYDDEDEDDEDEAEVEPQQLLRALSVVRRSSDVHRLCGVPCGRRAGRNAPQGPHWNIVASGVGWRMQPWGCTSVVVGVRRLGGAAVSKVCPGVPATVEPPAPGRPPTGSCSRERRAASVDAFVAR